jgi:hypothetical protein
VLGAVAIHIAQVNSEGNGFPTEVYSQAFESEKVVPVEKRIGQRPVQILSQVRDRVELCLDSTSVRPIDRSAVGS